MRIFLILIFLLPIIDGSAKAGSEFISTVMLSKGDSESIEKIRKNLKSGSDPNSLDDDGNPAIYWAIFNKNFKALKLLLSSGANTNLRDKGQGWTPLMHAAFHAARDPEFERFVGILIKNGADVNAAKDGITALSVAVANAKSGNKPPPVIEYLLQKGADPNIRASPKPELPGITPLMDAARSGKLEVIRILLKYKARANIRGPGGRTAVEFAKEYSHPEIQREIQSALK